MLTYCEAWRKGSTKRKGDIAEDELDGHPHPPSAERGEYCVADTGRLRTKCGNLVHRCLPFVKFVPPSELCPLCYGLLMQEVVAGDAETERG
jgi:hypothetical protein